MSRWRAMDRRSRAGSADFATGLGDQLPRCPGDATCDHNVAGSVVITNVNQFGMMSSYETRWCGNSAASVLRGRRGRACLRARHAHLSEEAVIGIASEWDPQDFHVN